MTKEEFEEIVRQFGGDIGDGPPRAFFFVGGDSHPRVYKTMTDLGLNEKGYPGPATHAHPHDALEALYEQIRYMVNPGIAKVVWRRRPVAQELDGKWRASCRIVVLVNNDVILPDEPEDV